MAMALNSYSVKKIIIFQSKFPRSVFKIPIHLIQFNTQQPRHPPLKKTQQNDDNTETYIVLNYLIY